MTVGGVVFVFQSVTSSQGAGNRRHREKWTPSTTALSGFWEGVASWQGGPNRGRINLDHGQVEGLTQGLAFISHVCWGLRADRPQK